MKKPVQILLLSGFLLTFIVTKQINVMRKLIDLTGKQIGNYKVIKHNHTGHSSFWLCECVCGNIRVVSGDNLRRGHSKGCGCQTKQRVSEANRKHGMYQSSEYSSWRSMKARCLSKNDPYYHIYGGRGIILCDRWNSFENFFADMGLKPTKKHSIDRIDVNGNYEPSNCRWATPKEQGNNTTRTRYVTFNGATLSLKMMSEKNNISYIVLKNRLRYGWSEEQALSTPVRKYKNKA